MENWKRRLKYYGIGFGLGLIFVFFFFQNRGCSWLPGNRVKNAILDRCVVISDGTEQKMKESGLTEQEVVSVLNDGDVLFSESDKEGDLKVYLLEREGIKYAFTLPKESFVSEVFVDVADANVQPTSQGTGSIFHFPKDDHLVFPDSTKLMTCQQEALDLINPKEILQLLKENGRIDFAKTNFQERPKPTHYLIFTKGEDEIGANVIWYKNKLNITSLESERITDCN